MPAMRIAAALALCLWLGSSPRTPTSSSWRSRRVEPAGPTHERISGKAYGELDPADPKNAVITDIELAPRNARGKVEYVTTFTLVRPTEMMTSSGVLLYTVVNRGGGNAVPHPAGHVTLVSGWQGDVVPTATNHTIHVPVARNRDGSSITGPLVLRFMSLTGNTTALVIPRGQPSPYPPASLDTTKASLVSATGETCNGREEGRREDSRARTGPLRIATTTPFPGKPDPAQICVKNGFDPALLYELQYTVKDPLVLGIGLAATRDLGAFFRYETADAAGTPNPVAGRITHAISEGSSQSGTFLRLSLLLGFNQDERGRIVWDGMNPHIAAGSPISTAASRFPAASSRRTSSVTKGPCGGHRGKTRPASAAAASLLDRCRASNTCPKIAETFGSAEIWGLRQSFTLVGTTREDRHPAARERAALLLPGRVAWRRTWGFATSTNPVKAAATCALPCNPAPAAPCAPR